MVRTHKNTLHILLPYIPAAVCAIGITIEFSLGMWAFAGIYAGIVAIIWAIKIK